MLRTVALAHGLKISGLSQGPSSATALVEVEHCAEPPPVRVFMPMHLQGA
jgi:hypothetical protein